MSSDVFKDDVSQGTSDKSEHLAKLEIDPDSAANGDLGITSLHIAAKMNDAAALWSLLESGENVDVVDRDGWTPLHFAAAKNSTRSVRVLIGAGASIEAKDSRGQTSLHVAARCNSAPVVRVLCNEANKEAADYDGMTPLHLAAMNGARKSVGDLLNAGADIEARNDSGMVPLHLAACFNAKQTVSDLCIAGASTDATDDNSETPLDLAIRMNAGESTEVLKEFMEKKKPENQKQLFTDAKDRIMSGLQDLNPVQESFSMPRWLVEYFLR